MGKQTVKGNPFAKNAPVKGGSAGGKGVCKSCGKPMAKCKC
jgi:hypothetical protein